MRVTFNLENSKVAVVRFQLPKDDPWSSFTIFISALQTPKLNQESCDVLYRCGKMSQRMRTE